MKIRLLLILAIVVFFYPSCKKYKYDENDHISYQKASKFLRAEPWIVSEYLVDGIESGNEVYSGNVDSSIFLNWKFRKAQFIFAKSVSFGNKGSGSGTFTLDYIKDENGMQYTSLGFVNFNWSLDKKANYLSLGQSYSGASVDFDFYFREQSSPWKILRLTDKELILSTTGNGHTYQMKLNTL